MSESRERREEPFRGGLSWEQMEAADRRALREAMKRSMGERLEEVFRLSEFGRELREGLQRSR